MCRCEVKTQKAILLNKEMALLIEVYTNCYQHSSFQVNKCGS